MDLKTLISDPGFSQNDIDIELFTNRANQKLEDYSFQIQVGNYVTAQRLLDEFLELQGQIVVLKQYLSSHQIPG